MTPSFETTLSVLLRMRLETVVKLVVAFPGECSKC